MSPQKRRLSCARRPAADGLPLWKPMAVEAEYQPPSTGQPSTHSQRIIVAVKSLLPCCWMRQVGSRPALPTSLIRPPGRWPHSPDFPRSQYRHPAQSPVPLLNQGDPDPLTRPNRHRRRRIVVLSQASPASPPCSSTSHFHALKCPCRNLPTAPSPMLLPLPPLPPLAQPGSAKATMG